jgi:cell division protein FtsW
MNKKSQVNSFEEQSFPRPYIGDDDFISWDDRDLSEELIKEKVKSPGIDKPFLIISIGLLLIGLIMVLSASSARGFYMQSQPLRLFMRQSIFAVIGVALMLITSRISIRFMSRWSMQLLLLSLGLLIAVPFIGIRGGGATRWIGFGNEYGFLTFQPSEIAKLGIIMGFAQMACKLGHVRMKTFKLGVLPFAIITGIMVILLRIQPHLSAIIIITALAAIMMFAGGTRLRWFMIALAVVAAMVSGFIFFQFRNASEGEQLAITADTIRTEGIDVSWLGHGNRRINAWLNPDDDPLGAGFQIRQSLNAVGSGGLLGQGLGQSRQKHLYLPEEHNDYIFAIVSEELGFIGAMLILMLFALLVIRGFWLAMNVRDKFGALITIGITSLLAMQVFLNVAVVTNLMPATGISLPLFSYGGTALLLQLVQIGIVLSVSREIPAPAPKEKETNRVPA